MGIRNEEEWARTDRLYSARKGRPNKEKQSTHEAGGWIGPHNRHLFGLFGGWLDWFWIGFPKLPCLVVSGSATNVP
jgi:hypothetical protein